MNGCESMLAICQRGQRRYGRGLRPLGLMLLAGVGACTTVRSTEVPHSEAAPAEGVTYYLPMRPMKLTATRTPIDLAEMQKALPAKQAALAEAKKAAGAAEAIRKSQEAVVASMEEDANARAEARAAADDKLAEARGQEVVAKKGAADAAKAVSDLSAAITAAQTSGAECTYEAKLELLPAQADTRKRYAARLVHNPFRDDTLNLKVNPAGLLTSGNVVAADRTADILVEFAGALAGVGGGGGPSAPSPPTGLLETPTPCGKLPKTFVRVFDPVSSGAVSGAAATSQRTAGSAAARAGVFTPELEGRDQVGTAEGYASVVNSELKAAQYPFRIFAEMPVSANGTVEPGASSAGRSYGAAEGKIFYRTPAPVVIRLEQTRALACQDDSCWQPVDMAIVGLPQAGPISYIPMNSAAFVKTVNDVQFADGAITSWSAERPSEVLEVVRLPVKIATAIISVPAQILSLKIDYSTKDRSLLEAQRLQMQARENWRQLNECLQAAGDNAPAAKACFAD